MRGPPPTHTHTHTHTPAHQKPNPTQPIRTNQNNAQVSVPTFLVPATRKVYDDLYSLTIGGRTLAQIFRDAGCIDPASPSCAACLGGPADTFARCVVF